MSISKERKDFWDVKHKSDCQGTTTFVMLKENLDLFTDKKVLEIGPGEGRQFNLVKGQTQDYSIADISQATLDEKNYVNNVEKYLLEDYSQDFDVKFDVIHFWYVIHHVRLEEIHSFFGFLDRHLTEDGLLIFNFPETVTFTEGVLENDGIKTTPLSTDLIIEHSQKYFKIVKSSVEKYNHISVIMEKKRWPINQQL